MKNTLVCLLVLSAILPTGTATAGVRVLPYSGCGTLVSGVECILFQADEGPLYVPIGDISAFTVGDHVRITGVVELNCFTICMQGDGCLVFAADAIEFCEVATGSVSWGSIKTLYHRP